MQYEQLREANDGGVHTFVWTIENEDGDITIHVAIGTITIVNDVGINILDQGTVTAIKNDSLVYISPDMATRCVKLEVHLG